MTQRWEVGEEFLTRAPILIGQGRNKPTIFRIKKKRIGTEGVKERAE
jgi:hypothetical protein